MILSKFKRRKAILIANVVFYYATVVIGTTIMPMFVADSTQRTIWFGIFLFLGNSSNALFGSGAAAWHMHFLPDGDDRNVFFSYSNLIAAIISTIVAIASSLVADSLAGSPRQAEIITTMRFVAAGMLVLSAAMLFLIPKEFT